MFLFQQCLWQSKMPKAWLCSTLVCFCSIFLYFVLANIEIYRSHTVVIFNLPETEIIPKDLYSEVISFFHNFLEMKHLTESDIVYAARFGRDNRTTQHRPVKVRFFSAEIPKEVFSKRRKLIGTGFVIARPRNGKEIEDLRILSRYEKKLNALYKDIETYITGTSLYIEKISHDADDILRLEKIENATQRQIEKGVPGPYQTYPVNVTTENPNNIEESSERQDLIDHILKRYQEKVQRRNPDAHVEIKSNKLHVNGVVYTVDQILVMEKKEHKEEVVFFSQIRNRPGVLTSWSYPSSTPNTPLFAREPRVWYTHKFEDLVNLNETTLKEYYNEEWKILKRGLMRDRIGMFASNIAAGMLWTEGYPYKVEEVLEREREINATKLLKRMKQMNISTTTTYMPETVYQRMQAEKKQWFQKIRQEKKDYIFDILRRYEAHYRMLNKHSVIAGVLLWINSLPHWADQCILRYEWEQQNPGHKYKWHPKRRPISSSELSSSSITSDYYSLSDYASSSDSDYRDEMDDSLSWSEKKRRRKERRRRKRPRKPSQFTPEERKTLEAGIRRNVIGGL